MSRRSCRSIPADWLHKETTVTDLLTEATAARASRSRPPLPRALRRSATPATGGSRWLWPSPRSPRACGWSAWSGRSSASAGDRPSSRSCPRPAPIGVLLPGAARRGGRRPRAAEAHPARRRSRRAGRDVRRRDAVADRHRPRSGSWRRSRSPPVSGWRSTTRPTRRGCRRSSPEADLHGGQRLRGHGAADDRPGARPGGGRRRRRHGVSPEPRSRSRPSWRWRPARADRRTDDPGAP